MLAQHTLNAIGFVIPEEDHLNVELINVCEAEVFEKGV
jgi:hypothetical protein